MASYNYDKRVELSAEQGCMVVIGAVALIASIYFLMPWVLMTAWTPIALAFNLPTFTYWNWFFISWAMRWLFKPTFNNRDASQNFKIKD